MAGRSSPLARLADIIFLTRPLLLCASATFFYAGAISALRTATGSYGIRLMLTALPSLALYSLVVAVAFVVNQVFDVKSDAVNRKNFILPANAVTKAETVILLALLLIAIGVLLRGRDSIVMMLVAVGLALGILYSVPPVRLKGKPIADLLANAIGFGWIGFVMGWLVFSDFGREPLVRSSPYVIAMAAIFLNTCIPDEVGDRAAGDSTTCVVFGKTAVSIVALALMCLAAAAGIISGEPILALAALGATPAFVAVAVRPTCSNSVLASQLAARILFLLVCVCAPILAVIGAIVYVASKIYYAKRFGVGYPRLTGADLEGSDVR
ncbi:MAG: UbiA family prenyltransferase [Candidatus Eisenbacteria bacterium]